MIRKLQRKFVAVAMLSLFIVLAALITVINVMNYRSVVAESDDALFLLSQSNSGFPDGSFFFGGSAAFSVNTTPIFSASANRSVSS